MFDARALPPTLTLQYHFNTKGTIRPYAGLGLNYTLFFNEAATSDFKTAMDGRTDVVLDDSCGRAANLGVDEANSRDWFINAGVKHIDIEKRLLGLNSRPDCSAF